MPTPPVVGARAPSQLIRQDDWIIIDGNAGVVIVDPSPIILAEYGFRSARTSWSASASHACATRPR